METVLFVRVLVLQTRFSQDEEVVVQILGFVLLFLAFGSGERERERVNGREGAANPECSSSSSAFSRELLIITRFRIRRLQEEEEEEEEE